MPQMMPMEWMFLYAMFTCLFIMLMVSLFYLTIKICNFIKFNKLIKSKEKLNFKLPKFSKHKNKKL
uniref:ATP synthase F0 subunit 8 n=1 Tax=Prosevania sp. ZJUH_2016031 TaxID=2491170 RepID=A0A3Q8UA53_9HYME|nr:ATP synthase F0 subunit 8 [Prosevania sp. ZJUH_2016031]